MVETHALLIGPWIPTPQDLPPTPGRWIRRIFHGDSGQPLGFAAWDRAREGLLASWINRRNITLFETEDRSLVMTLQRGFWRVWEVFDSEEHSVGTIYRNVLVDPSNSVLAYPRKPRPPESGAFLDLHGQSLALLAADDGWLLTFARLPETTPFTRMVLLAALLAWDSEPG